MMPKMDGIETLKEIRKISEVPVIMLTAIKEEMDKLKNVATLGTPLQFIKGNGEYVGAFVISQIQKTTEQTSPEGDLIAIQVELQLKEYAGKIPEDEEEQQGLKKKE